MAKQLDFIYDDVIEKGVKDITGLLKSDYVMSKRSIALLLLQGDADIVKKVELSEKQNYTRITDIIETVSNGFDKPLNYVISVQRQKKADGIAERFISKSTSHRRKLSDRLNSLTLNPLSGTVIFLLVLYFGLYKFVGGFGAGTLVDFLENHIFGNWLNPLIDRLATSYLPWKWLQNLLAGDYGIITLGIRYAVAIVLPIVTTFFITFSIIEDTGYLPRLSMLVDRAFKLIGLSGRAVIPMTLGFGCDTMATMVTRTLETKRERLIATLLLSLAIPCSAQLGVILGLLSGNLGALAFWIVFMAGIFLLVGYLSSKILPGDKPTFYMEIPPLRLPKLSNILVKTYTRMQWYFIEILPLFILASVLIWFLNLTGLFSIILNLMKPLVHFIGLPDDAAQAFLFGFFRRDYGAAGLYDLQKTGALNPRQLTVAASTLTLFVPCIAQFAMTVKERGAKTAFAMAAFIFPFAFGAGFVLNSILVLFER